MFGSVHICGRNLFLELEGWRRAPGFSTWLRQFGFWTVALRDTLDTHSTAVAFLVSTEDTRLDIRRTVALVVFSLLLLYTEKVWYWVGGEGGGEVVMCGPLTERIGSNASDTWDGWLTLDPR